MKAAVCVGTRKGTGAPWRETYVSLDEHDGDELTESDLFRATMNSRDRYGCSRLASGRERRSAACVPPDKSVHLPPGCCKCMASGIESGVGTPKPSLSVRPYSSDTRRVLAQRQRKARVASELVCLFTRPRQPRWRSPRSSLFSSATVSLVAWSLEAQQNRCLELDAGDEGVFPE